MEIQISVNNKIARQTNDVIPVCGNKDYTVVFAFDDEWDGLDTKTARFRYNSTYTDVVFTGDRCAMPSIQQSSQVSIGVYAGDLHTTTPAEVNMQWSILCGAGTPAAPSDDVYNQIMALLNGQSGGSGMSDDEFLQALIDTDTLPAVASAGKILTDENGKVILM